MAKLYKTDVREFILEDTKYVINEVEPHKIIMKKVDTPSFVCISENEVRKEVGDLKNDDLVFSLIDRRIKEALDCGVSVIYNATNLDLSTRQHYIELSGPVQKILHI